ncbi:hypothetical protein PV328_012285, partial [Microctonus aethiopoides]
ASNPPLPPFAPVASNPPLPPSAPAAANRPITLPLQLNFPFAHEGSITLPRRWARAGQNRDGQNTRTTYFNNRQMQQYTRGGRNSFRGRGGRGGREIDNKKQFQFFF